MEENNLTDKNLLRYIKESDIKNISELFSFGKFSEIIDSYFKKNKNAKKVSNKIELPKKLNLFNDIPNQNFSKSDKDISNLNTINNNNFNPDINKLFSNSSNDLSLFPSNDVLLNSPLTQNNNINNNNL